MRKGLVAIFCMAVVCSAFGEARRPMTCNDAVAWLSGNIPTNRLLQMSAQDGVSFQTSSELSKTLIAAGASTSLVKSFRSNFGNDQPSSICSPQFLKASAQVRRAEYQPAETEIRKLLEDSPNSAALHFALAHLREQQNDWNEAFDEYSESKRLLPELPQVHTRLAYVFYQMNDGDNAISEARTALSMDPQNAETLRILGLGLYNNNKYIAALNVFHDSLKLEPRSAETYFDIGMTLADKKDLSGATAAYRKAIQLNVAYWQAHNSLGVVMHDLGKLTMPSRNIKRQSD